ncbi:hypothetical protein TL16_g03683 [Triparma laevis f. inornata]|uniref:Uncharacterized protein n=1 Tax=Triparma laevis f. inornata TaxID=1714386 RepID=A0A9W7A4J5_9STRA|nr:hypothetical protein TL16_g03683 [Triparma laevis f. inornata]
MYNGKVGNLEDVKGKKEEMYFCKYDDGDNEHIHPNDLSELLCEDRNLVKGDGVCYDVSWEGRKNERVKKVQLMPLLVAHFGLDPERLLKKGKSFIGQKFERKFTGNGRSMTLGATIMREDDIPGEGVNYYVKYDDGEKEHLTFKELAFFLSRAFGETKKSKKEQKKLQAKKKKPSSPPELPNNGQSTTYNPYLFRTLTKKFEEDENREGSDSEGEDCLFEGIVMRRDVMDDDDEENPGAEMYFVRYEDGDSEHFHKKELKKLLDPKVHHPRPKVVPSVATDGPFVVKDVFPKATVKQLLTGFLNGTTPQKKAPEGGGRNMPKRSTQVFPGLLPFHDDLLAYRKGLATEAKGGGGGKTATLPVRVQQSTPYIEELVPRDAAGRRLGLVDLIVTALKKTDYGRDVVEKCKRAGKWEPKDAIKAIHILHTPANAPSQILHTDSPDGPRYWTLLIPLHDPSLEKGNEASGTAFYDKGLEEWRVVHPKPGSGTLFSGRVPHFGSDCELGKLVVYAVLMKNNVDPN